MYAGVRADRRMPCPPFTGAGCAASGRSHHPECALGHGVEQVEPTAFHPELTSDRRVDLVVTELAVISFADRRATLIETAPGVSVQQVLAATEADLVVPASVSTMKI